ncbi:SPFH domain-containing protein [Bacteroidia bacterium]|jgi:membrane protease subunit (stomatin/prohibitin family)|nr:SPFH domain-containing protein [Bacteroidia bacterium]|tara:strand:+ start:6482 stop:6739 length:258 start_codon:yes stop_codon:yes gene_type:complete
MAIIDVLKYDGPNDVLIWKWRSESNSSREQELRMGSQLIVNQSQEACFYKGGELLDVFGPGTHTLSTKNLPVLSGLVGLAYGGDV